jgi:carotenoid cleavage dioxygenase
VFDGERMVKDKQLPFRFAKEHGSRVGLVALDAPPKADGSADVRWFDVAPHMVFHTATAWEEGGVVKLLGCAHDSISLNLDTRSDVGIPEAERPRMAVVALDLASGEASLRYLTATVGDFPTLNPALVGRK